jgi:hypothetical protein
MRGPPRRHLAARGELRGWIPGGDPGYDGSRTAAEEIIQMNGRLGLAGILLTVAIAASGCSTIRHPPFTPLQLSITPGAEVFARDTPVYGLSMNALYGIQQEVSKDLVGVEVGFLNVAREGATGIQGGLGNSAGGSFKGLQAAVAMNQMEGDLMGAQLGVANTVEEGFGLQVGLANHAKSLKGVQLGLINLNESGFLPFFPGINIGF